MEFDAVVGVSVNSEVIVGYSQVTDVKVPANMFKYNLGGTSANVAMAMNSLGCRAKLLASCGEGDDDNTFMLERLLVKAKLDFHLLPVREETNAALLRVDHGSHLPAIGLKSRILPERVTTEWLRFIYEQSAKCVWRIATGVIEDEVVLAEKMFEEAAGSRVLNPRHSLMASPDSERILRQTDILVCNVEEFYGLAKSGVNPKSLSAVHDQGVSLVIVTNSKYGSTLSLNSEVLQIPAFTDAGEMVSEVGAGDWFTGGFFSFLSINGIRSVKDLNFETLEKAAKFASVVAGVKVTKTGGGNGPSLSEVESFLL